MRKINIYGISLIIVLISSCNSKEQNDKTDKIANQIINLLEDYKKNTGRYPEDLENLVPEYIKEIPKTSLRNRNNSFYYVRIVNDSTLEQYELYYYAAFGVEVRYNSLNRVWEYDD